MADAKYKLKFGLTDGTTVETDSFTVPQGPQGPAGPTGPQGLTGEAGPQGPKGDTGAAAGFASSMTVTVSTLEAGKDATVSVTPIASTPNTAKGFTFAFGIPKGAAGAKGTDGAKGDKGEQGVGISTVSIEAVT